MRIAIFNHFWNDFYTSKKRINSYGILNYLKEIIEKKHNVLVFDIVKNYKKEVDLPERLIYLKRYLKEDLTEYLFFSKYFQFGDKKNFNHKELLNFNPEVILISSFAFCYFNGFKDTVIYLKSLFPEVPIVAGGSGISSNPLYYLKNTPVDYVVVGPAELSLNRLLDYIEEGISPDFENVISKKDLKNYKIDINRSYYFKPFITKIDNNTLSLQLTRGCPHNCSYCSIKSISGNKFLFSRIEEIKERIDSLDIGESINFCFEDDNITYKKEYFLEIVRYIKEKYKDATFSLENGGDWKSFDNEYLEKLLKYGLKQLNISLTTINNRVLFENKRGYYIEEFDEFIDKIEKISIPVIVYFICGLPYDNKENILNTLLYLAAKRVIIGISMFYPVPGTEIVKKITKRVDPELCKGTSFYKWGNIKTKTLITFFILTRFINSIKKIDFFDIDYLKNLFNKIEISNFTIKGTLSRREITIIGIIYSIKCKKIFSINLKNGYYILEEYNCDKSLLRIFFRKILNENIIYTDYGKIEPFLWKKILKTLFQ